MMLGHNCDDKMYRALINVVQKLKTLSTIQLHLILQQSTVTILLWIALIA